MGTSPMKEPMVLPVSRSQSPTSTANANPVRVPIPRRQPSRWTIGENSQSAAIWAIAASRRSRLDLTLSTAS